MSGKFLFHFHPRNKQKKRDLVETTFFNIPFDLMWKQWLCVDKPSTEVKPQAEAKPSTEAVRIIYSF